MKKPILFMTLMSCVLLTGCSGISEIAERELLAEAGIEDDAGYKQYQRLEKEGKVTPDGYSTEAVFAIDDADENVPENAVHVTFAENPYLNTAYFADTSHKETLNTLKCYLTSGSKIYAEISAKKTAPSSAYEFDELRIYLCSEDGSRELISNVKPDDGGFIFEITDEYIGTEIAIEPVGRYKTKTITLNDYLEGDDGHIALGGTWTVNNKETVDNEAEISAVSSTSVSYCYDSNEYFFVSSEPACFYCDSDDGIVTFRMREPTDTIDSYSVELQRYINVSAPIKNSIIVKINGENEKNLKAGDKLTIQKLKYGSTVTVVTNREFEELENCRDLVVLSCEETTDGYKYTMVVPQKGGEFAFDPNEYTYEHGTVTFMCYGEKVTGTQYLARGTTISYEAASADDGYWLGSGDKTIIVGDEKQTKAALNSIRFVPKIRTTVILPQPEYGGSIDYYADGSKIDAGTYQTTSGAEIEMIFHPWEGWICNYNNGEKYAVSEETLQTVTVGGKNVDYVFAEDEEHKPVLTVTLDKSVGENAEFLISAQGIEDGAFQFESRFLKGNDAIIKKQKIGTGGIKYSVKNRAIQSGTAIKVLIETTDSSNNKESYYRLIDDIMTAQGTVELYGDAEQARSDVWYKSVNITFSVVDAHEFTQPTPIKNAEIIVRNENFGQLKTGDIVDDSAKVTLSIKPDKNYYVSGKNVKDGVYQSTMSYSDYREKVQKIIDTHSVEPYYLLKLEEADSFGSCTYELDGKKVSGSVYAKEGQKLTIEYKLTGDGFAIDGAKGGILSFAQSDQKITKSVKVSAEMDGAVVTRDTFGIVVVKAGDK